MTINMTILRKWKKAISGTLKTQWKWNQKAEAGEKTRDGGTEMQLNASSSDHTHTNTRQPPLWHAWRWRRVGSGIRVVPHELDVRVHHFFNKLLFKYTYTHRLFLKLESTGSEPHWFLYRNAHLKRHPWFPAQDLKGFGAVSLQEVLEKDQKRVRWGKKQRLKKRQRGGLVLLY